MGLDTQKGLQYCAIKKSQLYIFLSCGTPARGSSCMVNQYALTNHPCRERWLDEGRLNPLRRLTIREEERGFHASFSRRKGRQRHSNSQRTMRWRSGPRCVGILKEGKQHGLQEKETCTPLNADLLLTKKYELILFSFFFLLFAFIILLSLFI